MKHAAPMQRAKRRKHVERNLSRVGRRQRPAGDARRERLTVEQLHCNEQLAVVLTYFIQLTDVRVADARSGTRFAAQALTRFVAGELGSDCLECDRATETRVVGGVDDAHAAFAQLVQDSIGTELRSHQLAGQRGTASGYEAKSIITRRTPRACRVTMRRIHAASNVQRKTVPDRTAAGRTVRRA